jgi:predicted RecA/RadA family phage recombinase
MVFRDVTDDVLIDSGVDANLRSYTAEEAVLAGQVVKAGAAAESVEPSDTDGEDVLGVALEDAAVGDQVTVARDGCKVRATSATGTVSAGDFVASHGATGEEGEVDTKAAGEAYLGVAVADDAGANDDVKVEINIGTGA